MNIIKHIILRKSAPSAGNQYTRIFLPQMTQIRAEKFLFFSILFLYFFLYTTSSDAQRLYSTRKGSGNCFCDAASKNKGSWYVSLTFQPAMNFYSGDVQNENKTTLAPGLKIGTNISKKVSVQSGVDYYSISGVNRDDFYTKGDFTYLDIPVTFIIRFPNEKNGFIPYLGISGINNLHLKQRYYFDPDTGQTEIVNGISYNTFYAGLHGGMFFVLKNNLSFFTEVNVRQSLAGMGKTGAVDNYVNQAGLGLGFNFHF
ncbi:MAG: hypothetical protein ACOZCO_12345 [Bacteroidota bacterium]